MTKQVATTDWVKAGYPYLKAGSGLPSWLLPEGSLNTVADNVGPDGLEELARALQLAMLDRVPDTATASPEDWGAAVSSWPPLKHVRGVVEAFLEVAQKVKAQLPGLSDRIDTTVLGRYMAVILFCPFVEPGHKLWNDLAELLGCDKDNPAQLVVSYTGAIERGDVTMLERVCQCVGGYAAWDEWSKALEKQILGCQSTPRLIAVTPPLSAELMSVLASMMKEGSDETRGDPTKHTGSQFSAQ